MSHPAQGGPVAVFGYGSLVSAASAAETLGRVVERVWPAELRGWRRGFIQARHNPSCEKTFALADTGEVPEWVLGLAVAPGPGDEARVNGALIELQPTEADRLDLREMRYERREVTAAVTSTDPAAPRFARVFTYEARRPNRAPTPPEGAVILRSYMATVEAAFDGLGPGELDRFRSTTPMPSVPIVDGRLVRDEIPVGNPRDW